jgi:hypothetical protein
MPPGGYYYDMPYHPLAGPWSRGDIDGIGLCWQLNSDAEAELRESLRSVHRTTEYAIVVETWTGGWAGHYEVFQLSRGWDDFLVDLLTNPDLARYMLEVRLEAVPKRWHQMLPILGDVPEVVCVGEDHQEENEIQDTLLSRRVCLQFTAGPNRRRNRYPESRVSKRHAYGFSKTRKRVWEEEVGNAVECGKTKRTTTLRQEADSCSTQFTTCNMVSRPRISGHVSEFRAIPLRARTPHDRTMGAGGN